MTTYSNIRYAAAGVTEYATADDLPTTAASGSQAFVAGTNRLYIWNGTGWYNIALINTNPTISGVSSSYSLAQDGTATTVTIVASDPEGIPITYSIASDTSGSIATVAQGTGASTNVFTITPSTSEANAGTFTLTFRASDGVNIATAPAEFSLEFQVVNSHYTSALITSVGANNAVNNTFIDSSSNSHTITASGNATQTTFSPYRHGGYSLYFPGATTMDLGFSTLNSGNWTFECWAIIEAGELLAGKYNGGNQLEGFGVSNTTGYMYTHTGAGVETPTCNTDLRDGKWHYLVWERYNGTYYYWADGSLETSFANTETPAGGGNWSLGGWSAGQMTGNIKEARLSLTTAVYSGNAPTTPTEPQTAAKSTDAFFTGVGLEVKDYSSNNRTFTVPAALELQATAPYDYNQYSSATDGGSIYLDGTGDYIGAQTSTVGTGDFTLEAWVYRTATGATWQSVIAQRAGSTSTASQFAWGIHSSGYVYFFAGAHYASTAAGAIGLNRWHHIACTRSGTTVKQFVDGVEKVSGTSSNNLSYNELTIGANYTGTEPFTGIVSDPRVVFGTSVYNSAFTPPTSPLTAVTNTEILVKSTNAGIIDKSQSLKEFILGGNTKSSTTQTKYLTSSMAFDGTGDNIPFYPSAPFGTGDFTIEFWWYPTDTNKQALFMGTTGTDHSIAISYGMPSGNTIGMWASSNGTSWNMMNCDAGGNGIGSETVNQNAWNHIAMTRASGTFKLFVNGALDVTITGQTGQIADYGQGTYKAIIGQWYTTGTAITDIHGYLSDFRISNGLARYTSAFTPPTAALKG